MFVLYCPEHCVFLERRLHLRLQYDSYGSVITSDRLIQLSAIAVDNQTPGQHFHKAEKTIVLDEPEIAIKVRMDDKNVTENQTK